MVDVTMTITTERVVSLEVRPGSATDLVFDGTDECFYIRRTEIATDGSIGDVMRIRFDPATLTEGVVAIEGDLGG